MRKSKIKTNTVASAIYATIRRKSFLLLTVHSASPDLHLEADDIAVATWAFQHKAVAGYDTDTLHGSRLRYIPIYTSTSVLGIMGVKPAEPDRVITRQQSLLLTAFATQTAVALERVHLCKVPAE